MKTILLCLTLAFASLPAAARAETITKTDIIKTVEHLQARCHEAEAAQAAAQAQSADLQKSIDDLAVQEQKAKDKAAALQKENGILAGRLDKLGWALAAVAGLFAWALASKFATLLPTPWNLIGPIAAGIFVSASVFGYLRFLL